jgi:hypothetical protein
VATPYGHSRKRWNLKNSSESLFEFPTGSRVRNSTAVSHKLGGGRGLESKIAEVTVFPSCTAIFTFPYRRGDCLL